MLAIGMINCLANHLLRTDHPLLHVSKVTLPRLLLVKSVSTELSSAGHQDPPDPRCRQEDKHMLYL